MSTVTIKQANFVDRMINGKYRVKMPKALAEHDSFDNWERERFECMEAHLKLGDVLFDVGAETGHISAIYAGFVGAPNLVMFESNPDNWQNIKATWDEMGLAKPGATVVALVSDVGEQPEGTEELNKQEDGWPVCALTGRIWTPRSYRYVWEHAHNTPQVTLDEFAAFSGWIPDAITIDVEGAELKVLRGAARLLRVRQPLVWVSIHPDLMRANCGHEPEMVQRFMTDLGYCSTHLATDHEVHMFYEPIA